MTRMKHRDAATLIGDVIGSRRVQRRDVLHRGLDDALQQVNRTLQPADPLQVTVGDEFQGSFDSVPEAVRASLRIRLGLLPDHDVRIGIGWGGIAWIDREADVQDGPGWWAARDAIDLAKRRAKGTLAPLRTWFTAADPHDTAVVPERWNALLVCRYAIVSDLDHRSVAILTGLLADRSQQDIAGAMGVSASAVSQRVRRDRLAMVVTADRLLVAP